MKLKSFGCSFIFGTDLSDDRRRAPYRFGSRLTWPGLVAQTLGYEYHSYARPGSGNLQILERLLNEVAQEDPAIYVIGWTWIDRFDYVNDNEILQPPIDQWPGAQWQTLLPQERSRLAQTYFKHLNCEYSDKLRSLIYISTAIDSLRKSGCQFIMTAIDPLVFCDRWHMSPATLNLLQQIKPYISQFEGRTFLEWSENHGYPISAQWHPLEQAHAAAAKLVCANLENYVKR